MRSSSIEAFVICFRSPEFKFEFWLDNGHTCSLFLFKIKSLTATEVLLQLIFKLFNFSQLATLDCWTPSLLLCQSFVMVALYFPITLDICMLPTQLSLIARLVSTTISNFAKYNMIIGCSKCQLLWREAISPLESHSHLGDD